MPATIGQQFARQPAHSSTAGRSAPVDPASAGALEALGRSSLEASPAWEHLASVLPFARIDGPAETSPSMEPDADGPDSKPDAEPDAEPDFWGGAGEHILETLRRVLTRTERCHALLTGRSGVGRTTLLWQFARRAACGHLWGFEGATALRLDVADVGPEDSRHCLETLFAAVRDLHGQSQGPVLLCLDGLATLVRSARGGDNKPLLRTLLRQSGVRLAGTMSDAEYTELVGSDARMRSLFQRLSVAEPEGERLAAIVERAAHRLEAEYSAVIGMEAIERAVALSSTFCLSEAHPAKSIRVLRQAVEDAAARRHPNGDDDDDPQRLEIGRLEIGAAEVIEVLEERTGIPRETLSGEGRRVDFAEALAAAVVGQATAVREVATELEMISAGLNEPGKPASVLMFAGMTGVGKTELAKRIAELYATSRRPNVYSMGNFTEPHSVSGLVGVPPGYVGHDAGGRLVNELLADPYAVFLLDEAEKCHPNVWKPFLNLFDEGWIVDQRGVKAYAERAIFILTTNAGDRNVSQLARSGKPAAEIARHVRQSLSRVRQERSSQPVFPPQFLSRMKRIIVFSPLDGEAMQGIAGRATGRLARRWKQARRKEVLVAPEVVARIAARALAVNEEAGGQEGGRIVARLMSDHVEHAIFRRSLAEPDLYERCGRIVVTFAETASSEAAAAEALPPVSVQFVSPGAAEHQQ